MADELDKDVNEPVRRDPHEILAGIPGAERTVGRLLSGTAVLYALVSAAMFFVAVFVTVVAVTAVAPAVTDRASLGTAAL